MVRRKCFTDQEKAGIVSKLAKGESVSNVTATLSRDVRTVRKFVSNPLAVTIRKDKGKSKVLMRRDLSRVKRQLRKNPNSTSKNVFDNVRLCHVSKSTRCRVLRHMAKHVIPDVRPPLKPSHKDSRLEWARNYMKLDFKHVLFTDEMRATLTDLTDGAKSGFPKMLRALNVFVINKVEEASWYEKLLTMN